MAVDLPQRCSFKGPLGPYTLDGIKGTDRELGRGAETVVVELECRGLKCAGKKIYESLEGDSNVLRRLNNECRLLSQIRHPNVVQFLGVHFEGQLPIPILVMEFLPTNLNSCINQYGILPKEINYSILHDVSLGLNYLHNQIPPIVHQNLSADNILLSSNITAKISDLQLGVAKILNHSPLQISDEPRPSTNPSYVPPELIVANPTCDTSIDVFQYGIMMIHVFSGKLPHPTSDPVHVRADGQQIPVSEAKRREVYLCDIGHDHPLMDLILTCIHTEPQHSLTGVLLLKLSND